jgi:hypothetical protein
LVKVRKEAPLHQLAVLMAYPLAQPWQALSPHRLVQLSPFPALAHLWVCRWRAVAVQQQLLPSGWRQP